MTPGTLSGSVVNGIVTLACGATNFGSLPTGHLDTAFATPAPAGVYFVRVRAVNAFGSSAPTNEVQLVVP